jgi:DNA-binding response OmpR family regulator
MEGVMEEIENNAGVEKPTLLLVTRNAELVEKLRRRLSMPVVTASTARAAREAVEDAAPSCVIVDFSIGQRSALALASELRSTRRGVMTIGLLDRGDKLVPRA